MFKCPVVAASKAFLPIPIFLLSEPSSEAPAFSPMNIELPVVNCGNQPLPSCIK